MIRGNGNRRTMRVATSLCGILALVACGSAPKGQVVATVNGEEITARDLNVEAQALHIPPTMKRQQSLPIVMQSVVDRILLAQSAKTQKLDQDPDYLAQYRRIGQLLLAQRAMQAATSSNATITSQQLGEFTIKNPALFDRREKLTIRQMLFPLPADRAKLKTFEPIKTMESFATALDKIGLQHQASQRVIDTAELDPKMAAQLAALPPGELFMTAEGNTGVVAQIVARAPFPTPIGEREAVAERAMDAARKPALAKETLAGLRASAKIDYQPGYLPPAKSDMAVAGSK